MSGPSSHIPIVFVHGDSDTAAHWIAQFWRFRQAGWPASHLLAADFPHPGAPLDDGVVEENRSTTTELALQLRDLVARLTAETGFDKIALIGSSRGCNTIRNYLRNFGGAPHVETIILCGGVHHGVMVNPNGSLGSEFNGAGHFLSGLNMGLEVMEGVRTVTIRSDKYDLYNQPMGDWIGLPGIPVGGHPDGAALDGAENLVIPGADHREVAFSETAFAMMIRVLTGRTGVPTPIMPEPAPALNGKVTGWANERPTNLPLTGARLRIYATNPVDGERQGDTVHDTTIGADGYWGPFTAVAGQTYEFEITADGYPVHHIYRSAFARSFDYLNLRLYPSLAEENEIAVVNMMRPRGYFGTRRDVIELGGETAPGIADTEVPGIWQTHVPALAGTTVTGRFNGEVIVARVWPADHTVWIELTH